MTSVNKLSELDGGPAPEVKSSIFVHLEPSLRDNPDGVAVVVFHQQSTYLSKLINEESETSESLSSRIEKSYLEWTYRQLHLASVRLANAFLAAGIKPGSSTIACLLPNGVEFFLLHWTAMLLKVSICNLDFGSLQAARRDELTNFITTINPDAILVPHVEGAYAVDKVLDTLPLSASCVKIITGSCEHANVSNSDWMNLEQFGLRGIKTPFMTEADLCKDAKHDDPDRIHLILFTSGTSVGKPKGCPRSLHGLLQMMETFPAFSKGGPYPRSLMITANFRVIAPIVALRTLKGGGTAIMPSATFDPEAALKCIEKFRVTSLNTVPFHLHSMVDHPKYSTESTSSVNVVTIGGDIITKDLLKKAEKAFPMAKSIISIHGMTEGAGLVQLGSGRNSEEKLYISGIVSIGKVAKGIKLRIVDTENGQITLRDTPGELHVCSNIVIKHYLNGVKSEDFYRDQDGQWFKTGDLGVIDQSDNVYILGRVKDIIKRAGVPITPAALENCVERHTGSECSVIGIPHPTLGHEPFAVVKEYGATNESQLKQLVLDEFGKDYALAGAASLEQLGLDEFPINTTGKIVKRDLEQPVAKYLQSRA